MTILNPWPEHKNPRSDRIASAPYNFVPLPEKIIPAVSDAEELPGHDEYDRKRLSGYFDVTLTARSPLYIRGPLPIKGFLGQEQDQQIKNKPEFFYTHDEQKPVIPGSSLRGMLRSLLEIVSYSKVQWVSEKQLFFRTVDDTVVGEHYRGRMGGHVETGFLIRQGDTYLIRVCSMARVERPIIGKPLYDGTAPNLTPRWQGENGKSRQYAPVWVKVQFRAQAKKGSPVRPNMVEELSYQKRDGLREGRLVITGDVPKKKKEFVFLLPEGDAEQISVSDEIINRFHDEDQLTQWQEKAFPDNQPTPRYRERNGMLGRSPTAPGDPIFFLRENGKLTFIGRAQMFRLPYSRSPFDLVPPALRSAKQIDYAEALFGFVRTRQQLDGLGPNPPKQGEKGRAYAGRVIVTDAVLQSDPADIWLVGNGKEALVSRILASPKPTAFQQYLTQQQPDGKRKLDHYGSVSAKGDSTTTIRGHKLYWHQGLDTDLDLNLEEIRKTISEGVAQAEPDPTDTQRTRFKPLRPGVTFSFRVHFENLSKRELGALCWTLHPHGEAGQRYCHHLGMGKPLGMGAVELHARLHLIDRAQRYNTLFSDDGWQLGESVASESTSERVQPPVESGEAAAGGDLALPDVLEHWTKPFEKHLLHELNPSPSCEHLRDLRRIAMLLKMLSWPGYRAVEGEDNRYLADENPPRPNTRYMTIRPNEYRARFVLPDPTQFDPSYFEGKLYPQKSVNPPEAIMSVAPVSPGMPAKDPDMQRAENEKRSLEALREAEVAGHIHGYYQQWQRLTSTQARELLARAIVAKVRKAKREEDSAKKLWYQELLASLPEEKDTHAASD